MDNQNSETTVYSGLLGEVVHIKQLNGRIFEYFRRPPGTRLIIVSSENKILLTQERRREAEGVDLRLPGGKVCDDLGTYHKLLNSGQDILDAASKAATKEALEETGIIVKSSRLITKASAGATVDWDLYYFLVDEYEVSPDGQQLEDGEEIEGMRWMSTEAVRTAISNGEMQEWRSAGVLLGLVIPQIEANKQTTTNYLV